MKKLTMFLGVLGVASLAPMAHANLQLSWSLSTPDPTTGATVCATTVSASPTISASCFNPGPVNIGGGGGGVSVTQFGSNGTQGSGQSKQFSSVVEIDNNSGASQTLTLWAVDQNFTSPLAPPGFMWRSNLQFTSTSGTGTVGMMSCLDTANKTGPPTDTFCGGAGSATLNNSLLAFSGVDTPPEDTVSLGVGTLSTPFSMGEKITVVMSAGSSININTSQILTQVPEPMSIALLGGVLLLTVGAIRRKQKA